MEERKSKFRPQGLPSQVGRTEAFATRLRKQGRDQTVARKRARIVQGSPDNGDSTMGKARAEMLFGVFASVINNPGSSTEREQLAAIKGVMERKPVSEESQALLIAKMRRMVSRDHGGCEDLVVELGLVPCVVDALDSREDRTRVEAAWALTNIAATNVEYSDLIVSLKGHTKLASLAESPSASIELKEQSLWALANLAADSDLARTELVFLGLAEKLMLIFGEKVLRLDLLRQATAAFASLVQGRPPLLSLESRCQFAGMAEGFLALHKPEITENVLTAISHITHTADHRDLLRVLESLPLHTIVDEFKSQSKTWAVKIAGNICAGPQCFVDRVLDSGALPAVATVLKDCRLEQCLKEACWLVSNVAIGPPRHIQQLIDAGIAELLCGIISSPTTFSVKKEALYGLVNMCDHGSEKQQLLLGNARVLSALITMLEAEDPEILLYVMGGITIVLQTEEGPGNPLAEEFDSLGGVGKLERLQMHEDMEVFKAVQTLLDRFYYLDQTELNVHLAGETEYVNNGADSVAGETGVDKCA